MSNKTISPEVYASRILSKGQITDLVDGFSLQSGNPFSLFVIPNPAGTLPDAKTAIVECRLHLDGDEDDCPFQTNCWDKTLVSEVSMDGIDLANFDVFWGTASKEIES